MADAEVRKRLLLADADAGRATEMGERLTRLGYCVSSCQGERESVMRHVREVAPALVLWALEGSAPDAVLTTAHEVQQSLRCPVLAYALSPTPVGSLHPVGSVGVSFCAGNDDALHFAIEGQIERYATEERLRRTEERFTLIGETIREAFWIIAPDLSEVEYVSPAFASLFGMSVETFTRDPKGFLRLVDPGDMRMLRETVTTALLGVDTNYRAEFGITRLDGEKRRILSTAWPARDGSGRVRKVVGISEDVTERKATVSSLHLMRFAIDHASDSIIWIDRSGRFLYINEAGTRALGYTRDELMGQPVSIVDPRVTAETWPGHWRELTEKGSILVETEQITKSGRSIPVEIRSDYVSFEGEEIEFAFVHDVTDRK